MYSNPNGLIFAVSKALGRKLDRRKYSDRLIMQKGCYLLNTWGYGPFYRYKLFIRGPYSSELADDYYEVNDLGETTSIPEEKIAELAKILEKGDRYVEAYATVLLVKANNPGRTNEVIFNKAVDIEPKLISEVKEACDSILI